MITDLILDFIFSALDWVGDRAEALTSGMNFSALNDLAGSVSEVAPLFGIMANFVHLSVIGGALALVVTWEAVFVTAKLALKLYRLVPFKAS